MPLAPAWAPLATRPASAANSTPVAPAWAACPIERTPLGTALAIPITPKPLAFVPSSCPPNASKPSKRKREPLPIAKVRPAKRVPA